MPTGHDVAENVLDTLDGRELVAGDAHAALVGNVKEITGEGLAAAVLERFCECDGEVLDASHRRVPPQTGQVPR